MSRRQRPKATQKAPIMAGTEEAILTYPSDSRFRFPEAVGNSDQDPQFSLKELAKKYEEDLAHWNAEYEKNQHLLTAKQVEFRASGYSGPASAAAAGRDIENLLSERDRYQTAAAASLTRLVHVQAQRRSMDKAEVLGLFKNARHLPESVGARTELLAEFQKFDAFQWTLACAVAQEDSRFLDAIDVKANQLLSSVIQSALAGGPEGIRSLSEISLRLVRALEEVEARHPAVVRSLAEHEREWPVLFLKPRYAHIKSIKRLTERMQKIGLGQKLLSQQPIEVPVIDHPSAKLAWALLLHLQRQRTLIATETAVRAAPAGKHVWVRQSFDDLQKEAAALAPLSEDTCLDWWAVARKFLERDYPGYWDMQEFDYVISLVRKPTHSTAKGGKTLVNRQKGFNERMSDHFETFVGKNQTRAKKTRTREALAASAAKA